MVSIRKLYSSLLQINVLFIAHLKNNDTKSSEIGNDISFVNRTRNFYLQKNKCNIMSSSYKPSGGCFSPFLWSIGICVMYTKLELLTLRTFWVDFGGISNTFKTGEEKGNTEGGKRVHLLKLEKTRERKQRCSFAL